jgi:hypothetical protein
MTQDEIIDMAIKGHASTRDAIRWAMNQKTGENMTHTKDEALKLALTALESCSGAPHWEELQPTVTAIKRALATPVQEPVATLFGSLPVYDTTTPAQP